MNPSNVILMNNHELGGNDPTYILGPCVIESESFILNVASKIKNITDNLDVKFIFKASYDKANRSSVDSFRGIECLKGCKLLYKVKEELKIPVTTDVHTSEEAKISGDYVDIIQIPAFLCRQTDIIKSAAETGKIVNVKKGQFLAPQDVKNIAEKLIQFNCKNFFFTERGSSFGYQNLVADMRSIPWIQEQGYKVIFDATHSVQRPGGLGNFSGGDGYLAPILARSAVAAGCDGIFMETHPDPSKALSDSKNQLPLDRLSEVLNQLTKIYNLVRKF